MDLIRWSQTPHRWAKLEHLGRDARVDHEHHSPPIPLLDEVVGSRGKAVVSTRKIGKSPHLALSFPNKPKIDIADVVRPVL